jgi:hypothetical protein
MASPTLKLFKRKYIRAYRNGELLAFNFTLSEKNSEKSK